MDMTKVMATRVLGAALAAFLLLAGSARAEEAKASRPYVLLIGIANYADKEITPRPHAEDDAKALYNLLTDKEHLGTDPKNAQLLLGKEATKAKILESLRWLAREAGPNDPVYLGFVGDGALVGKESERRCYLAYDSSIKDRDKDGVGASEVADALKGLKSQRFVSLIDVEYVGFKGNFRSLLEHLLDKDTFKELLGDDGSSDHGPLPGRIMFIKTTGLTPSLDLKDHGLFTQVLLDGLNGKADTDGYEPDGLVTVDELIDYVDSKVSQLAREHGKTADEKQQVHFVLGSRGNHYELTRNPAVTEKTKERLTKLEELAKAGKVKPSLAEEGRLLLSRMPRLEAQRNLRKEYQKLVDGASDTDKFLAERETILDGTKLRRSDAMAFATKVLEAIKLVNDMYVKETNQGEMVAWAVLSCTAGPRRNCPTRSRRSSRTPRRWACARCSTC